MDSFFDDHMLSAMYEIQAFYQMPGVLGQSIKHPNYFYFVQVLFFCRITNSIKAK